MGIVQRQGFWNMGFTYLGVVVGYANKVLFYRAWLSESQFGLIEVLLAVMVISTEMSLFGLPKVINRFFPFFQDHPTKEGQFTAFFASYALLGFGLLAGLLWLLEPVVVNLYMEKSPQFAAHYFYLIPLVLGYGSFKVLQAVSQAQLKSIVPIFANQFVLRIIHAGLILVYYAGWLDFTQLLQGYVIGYAIPSLIVLGNLIYLGKVKWSFSLGMWRSRVVRIILGYGLFVTLADASMIVLGKIDTVMIAQILGEIDAGAYMVAFYIATLVAIPGRSIGSIVMPLIAIHIRKKAWPEVQSLYQKNAIANLLLGGLLLIGIWVNLDTFFALNDKHVEGRMAAIIVSLGYLFNVAAGPNRPIILLSKHFRFDLILNTVLLVLAIIGNWFLIPSMGLTGAALATAGTMTLYNVCGVWFVWKKLDLFPYTWATLWSLGLIIVVLLIGSWLPLDVPLLLDLVLRSALVTVLYLTGMLSLRVLPEANDFLLQAWKRVRG